MIRPVGKKGKTHWKTGAASAKRGCGIIVSCGVLAAWGMVVETGGGEKEGGGGDCRRLEVVSSQRASSGQLHGAQ